MAPLAHWQQTNFLGGEWSPFFQGRTDHPRYRSAMNRCYNGFPIEEGAWVRRPGSRLLAPSFKGQQARLYPFFFTNTAPYQVEFTDGFVRFFNNAWPVITEDVQYLSSISTANPAVVTLTTPVDWSDNDEIAFIFEPTMVAGNMAPLLRQRTFLITMVADSFSAWSNATTYGTGSIVNYTAVDPAWSSATTYAANDRVVDVGVHYISIRSSNLNHTPAAAAAAWSNVTTYAIGDVISYGGNNYISIVNSNLNHQPDVSPSQWTLTTLTNGWWQVVAAPVQQTYTSIQPGNLNHEPDTSPSWWIVENTNVTRKFSIKDAITGANIDGSTLGTINPLGVSVVRGLRVATPYTAGEWATARIVQNEDIGLIVNGTNIPQALSITPNAGSSQAATASVQNVIFHDGPYLPAVDNSQASVGGLSGTVEVTINYALYDSTKTYALGDYVSAGAYAYKSLVDGNVGNDPTADGGVHWKSYDRGVAVTGPGSEGVTGFQATDVGRLMRFWSQPSTWNGGNYTTGDVVLWDNVVYTAVANSSNVQPDTDPTIWAVNPTGQIWTWGRIISVLNSNTVSVQILGGDLLYNTTVNTWRLGVYSDTSGWPTCGIFHEGRFWLGGALPNRFDATESFGWTADGVLKFAPTDAFGNVTDASAIGYSFDAQDKNPIYWFAEDQRGLIAGTGGGEWLISPGAQQDGLTPTSITTSRVTRYRCADIEPRRTGISLVFVQKLKRRIMEFLSDVFTGRFVAPHLTETAKHLTQNNVEEIWYQEELAPLLWGRTGKNELIGATYRRISMMTSEAPQFIGWHQHALGHGRQIENTSVGPSNNGALDALAMVTNNTTTNVRWIEQLTTMFDEDNSVYDAWFVDGGVIPDMMYENDAGTGVVLTGLWYLVGETVAVWIAGLDVGDFTVANDGTITVPYGSGTAPTGHYDYVSPGGGAWKFTADWVKTVTNLGLTPLNGGIRIADTTITSTTITSNPNTTSKVLELLPAETVEQTGLVVDWNNGRASFHQTAPANGVSVLNINNGSEIVQNGMPTITGHAGDVWSNGTVGDTDAEGHLYCSPSSTGSNYQPLVKILTSDLSLTFEYGANSTFGPPGTGGITFPSSIAVVEANDPWVISLSTTKVPCFNSGTDGTFIAGNASSDPGYQGVNQSVWQTESNGGSIAKGAATHDGNVASAYIIQNGSGWPNTCAYFFIGVSDGVPTQESNSPNDGSTGKKGKGKKGASDGGVIHTPSVDNPLTYFGLIGHLAATDVDPLWTDGFGGWSGPVINWYDNAIIAMLSMNTGSLSAWSGATAYNVGDVVSKSSHVYVCTVAHTNHDPAADVAGLAFPGTGSFWREVVQNYCVCYGSGIYSRKNNEVAGMKWKVPLNGGIEWLNGGSQSVAAQGRLKGGLLGIISQHVDGDGLTPVYLIDTLTGKFYVGQMPGITMSTISPRGQCWDDQSQSLILVGTYNDAVTGAPTGLFGTTSFTTQWMRLYVGNLNPSPTITSTLTVQPNGYTFVYTDFAGSFPCVVGYPYNSEGQCLRAVDQQQTQSVVGPAFGTTRRSNLYAVLLENTLGIEIGTDFNHLDAPYLKNTDTGVENGPTELYSGIFRDYLEDRYTFDSEVCWRIVRPYPASVVSMSVWMKTEKT